MTATHQQRTEPLTDEQRRVVHLMADLCRAEPAVFSATVQRCDAMIARGTDRWEAHIYCLGKLGLW